MAADCLPVVVDTDIGNDIDDAVCLAYLLAQPRCELLGITTVTADPSLASLICSAASTARSLISSSTASVASRSNVPSDASR